MISKTQQIIQLASEGYRQADIAKKVGVSKQFVSQICWKHNIDKLITVTGIPYEQLFYRDGD